MKLKTKNIEVFMPLIYESITGEPKNISAYTFVD